MKRDICKCPGYCCFWMSHPGLWQSSGRHSQAPNRNATAKGKNEKMWFLDDFMEPRIELILVFALLGTPAMDGDVCMYVLVSEPTQARGPPLFASESIPAPCAAKVQATFLGRNAFISQNVCRTADLWSVQIMQIGSRRMCLISVQMMNKHVTCTLLGLKVTFLQAFILLFSICLSIRQDSVPFPPFT